MKKPETPKHAYLDTLDKLNTEPVIGRQEFVFFFDALDCNPNGDPDTGNLPRIDPETQHGLVTDVCIKRKIRNTIQMWADKDERGASKSPNGIFIQNTEALNSLIAQAMPKAALKEKDKPDKPDNYEKRNRDQTEQAKKWMMENFYDIRAFGGELRPLSAARILQPLSCVPDFEQDKRHGIQSSRSCRPVSRSGQHVRVRPFSESGRDARASTLRF
jgi:hypothetical protein